MDLQREVAVRQPVYPNSVVEVPRRLTVYRHNIQRAEIAAARDLLGRDLASDPLRLFRRFGRKFVRQVMLADYDFNIDAEVIRIAENLDDSSDGAFSLFRKFENLRIDDHAVEILNRFWLRRRGPDPVRRHVPWGNLESFGDLNPLLDALVGRDHKIAASFDTKLAHDSRVRPAKNPNNLALGAPLPAQARDMDQQAVAMHPLFRFLGG